jgi:hypothetical protein
VALDDIDLTLDYVDADDDPRVHPFWAVGAIDREDPNPYVELGWGSAGRAFLYSTPEAAQDALDGFDDDEYLEVVEVLVVIDLDKLPPPPP